MTAAQISARLDRLLDFLEDDPDNLTLLTDAAAVAFEERQLDVAGDLIRRHAAVEPLDPAMRNLAGLIALADGHFDDAARGFAELREDGFDEPGLRFNNAWALAMLDRHAEAAGLLDDAAVDASARGPTLKVQTLHHMGDLEGALSAGQALAERYPHDQALMGALATLAMDADHADLARVYAGQATGSPQGLAALGMFALEDQENTNAIGLFEKALAIDPRSPRALIGKGLALISANDPAAGARALDEGAAIFRTHLGSWIAAGWAHFMAGDLAKARESFGRALAIDPNFSESHGGLAVLDFMAGEFESAARQSEVALRLDRHSLGGALARVLLLESQGNPDAAARIRDTVLSAPIGPGGKTLIQALAQFGKH
jgi:tetratricopeptide (TPR) repeat protein